MSREDLPIFNFDLPQHRRVLKGYIDSLRGIYTVEFMRKRDQRSLQQNAYFHGVVIPVIARGMAAEYGYPVGPGECKHRLKERFIRRPLVNKATGEVDGYYTPSTADLDVAEMSQFIERCIAMAWEELNVQVPPAEDYQKKDERAA